MRLVDFVLRQGHLSQKALVAAVMAGDRPFHLDRCERCAVRAVELGQWLDNVRSAASEAADAAFPVERLAAQQAQIMRRLEQLDEPARVIAFPASSRSAHRVAGLPRVAPAWLGVAAAAGLIVGVIGGQVTARMGARPAATPAPAAQVGETQQRSESDAADGARFYDQDLERPTPEPLQWMDQNTARLVSSSYTVSRR